MTKADCDTMPFAIGRIEGGRGVPFVQPPFDAAAHGYVEEEFWIEGRARLFGLRPGTAFTFDGAWETRVRGEAPFRTRFLVRRPRDVVRCNGSVLLIWNNVTAGFDNVRGHPHLYEDGYILVGASVQRVGIEGFDIAQPKGLRTFDAGRYGDLAITTDDASYDIFTQIGEALRSPPPDGPDPLGGAQLRQLIARGGSQSAGRLTSYINGVAPHGHPFDGFLLDLRFGKFEPLETPLDQTRPRGISDLSTLVDGTLPPGTSQLRDIGVPVFVVNSETESRSHAAVRQPDSDRYRLWEAAGVSHAGGATASAAFTDTDLPPNWIVIQPLRDAALAHMHRWVGEGISPPVQPLIELEGDAAAGIPPRVKRDAVGVALGGLRLPQLDEPLARHSGFNGPGFAFLRGTSLPIAAGQLHARYGDWHGYAAALRAAVEAAIARGVLLPSALEPIMVEARPHWPVAL